MKQNFFRVTVSNRFQAVIQFLRKELNWKAGEPLVSEQWARPPSASAWKLALYASDLILVAVHVYQSCVFPRAR